MMTQFEVIVAEDMEVSADHDKSARVVLEETMTDMAAEGWQPVGGPTVIHWFTQHGTSRYEYHQLMGK